MSDEDAIINDALRSLQPQYPSLTIEKMRQIFDNTYERLCSDDVCEASYSAATGAEIRRQRLSALERRVVEAAIAYFVSQKEWTEHGVIGDWAGLYDDLWEAVDALIEARNQNEGK